MNAHHWYIIRWYCKVILHITLLYELYKIYYWTDRLINFFDTVNENIPHNSIFLHCHLYMSMIAKSSTVK